MHTILFRLYEDLENASKSLLTESRSLVAQGWDRCGKCWEGRLTTGQKETFWGDGYVRFLDSGGGSLFAYIHQNYLNVCSLSVCQFYLNKTDLKLGYN